MRIDEKNTKKMFRVLSCVIYTIISRYVCIDYLGYERAKLSGLRLGVSWRYKHLDKIMTTYWDLEFQIYYLICYLVRASRRTMNMLSYSNVLIGCFNTILIKDSIFLILMKTI